jgi:hypothetical protein
MELSSKVNAVKRLSDGWIDRIFSRMQGMYGSRWLDMWRDGQTVTTGGRTFDHGVALAKSMWAEELSGLQGAPERIRKALECCKSMPHPPTLPEFLALCRQQHAEFRALPAPSGPPEGVCRDRAQKLGEIVRQVARNHASVGSTHWMDSPPSQEHQGPWLRMLLQCAIDGNAYAIDRLQAHVASGKITSSAASAFLAERTGMSA